jgi:hypothetical protein
MRVLQAAANAMPPDDAAGFAAAHRQLLGDKSIQFTMTHDTMPKPPAWLKWLLEALATPTAKYILWALLAAGAAFLLFLLARHLLGIKWPSRRPRAAVEEVEDWRPEAGPARALLNEADALAAEGRFDEAAHLLLFRSIEDIDARRPALVRPALTSRDIADAPDLPGDPRRAFHAIVMLVEKSLFGGRSLVETEWSECRAAYESFAFAGAWR